MNRKIGRKTVSIFKIKNRQGYAALCADHLTEGSTANQAFARMEKAVTRTERRAKKTK